MRPRDFWPSSGDQDAAAEIKMVLPFMMGDKVNYQIVRFGFRDAEWC